MKHLLQPNSWIKNYGDYLFSHALYKVNDRELAEDLVQETFLSAIKAKESFNGEASEKTWLSVILKNKIIDYYRKKGRTNYTDYLETTNDSFDEHLYDSTLEAKGHVIENSLASDWGSHADSKLENKEFQKIMEQCLSKIPTRLSSIFLSKYFDDLKTEEICKQYDISAANYWVIIHRSKVILRTCLEKNWFTKVA